MSAGLAARPVRFFLSRRLLHCCSTAYRVQKLRYVAEPQAEARGYKYCASMRRAPMHRPHTSPSSAPMRRPPASSQRALTQRQRWPMPAMWVRLLEALQIKPHGFSLGQGTVHPPAPRRRCHRGNDSGWLPAPWVRLLEALQIKPHGFSLGQGAIRPTNTP